MVLVRQKKKGCIISGIADFVAIFGAIFGGFCVQTMSHVTSISLTRTDVTGTNQGHASGYDFLGFKGGFTRANGTTGTAETIYFATDRRNAITLAEGDFVPPTAIENSFAQNGGAREQ